MEQIADTDIDIETQEILLAASKHDVIRLQELLRTGSANVQDLETGFTPLHAAIAAFDDQEQTLGNEGSAPLNGTAATEMTAAEDTLKLLFANGAIWNDLDCNGETPGCIAWRCGVPRLYTLVVEAGVRAELLLNRLDAFQPLDSASSSGEEDEVEPPDNVESVRNPGESLDGRDRDAAILSNAAYLEGNLQYMNDRLVDNDQNGVMMSWETQIMEQTAEKLMIAPDLVCLNIGHGMGIIDRILQAKQPKTHHIIEAHPNVIGQMRASGWYDMSNVVVHEGRWQEVLPRLKESNCVFDAIYFDTFAEDYKDFKSFFSEYVVPLLNPTGRWSFFHGLGADRQCIYDVYTQVVEMELFEAGFDVEWSTIDVPDMGETTAQETLRRRYWALKTYKLPLCKFTT